MQKRQLVERIAAETDLPQHDVMAVVQKTLDHIVDALAEGRDVEFREFGIFRVVQRQARIGRNPNKPEDTVMIPAHAHVRFKPGRLMKQRVSGAVVTKPIR